MIDIKKLQISYVTDAKGKRTSVIMLLRQFNELLEDVEDLATVAEKREQPTIKDEDLIAELTRDGLIQRCMETICPQGTEGASGI